MSKKNNSKDNSQFSKLLIIISCVLVLSVVILAIGVYRNQKIQESKQEEPALEQKKQKLKKFPKFKDYDDSNNSHNSQNDYSNDMTKKQAIKHMRQDINYGFKLITAIKLLNSDTVTQATLSSTQRKILTNHFDSISLFNTFNQAVNISTPTGNNYYGQGGENRSYRTPKQGAKYTVVKSKAASINTTYSDFIFGVYIEFTTDDFIAKRKMIIGIDKLTGIISSVKNEGNTNSND